MTPYKVNGQNGIDAESLIEGENIARNNLIKRLKNNLQNTNLKLLNEKNKNNKLNENEIKDNYTYLSNLDKTILTLTQKIRQNDYSYILNNKVYKILFYITLVFILIILLSTVYFSIKFI